MLFLLLIFGGFFIQMNLATRKIYFYILLGTAILAFGLYNIHAQSPITEGGILGTTLLLKHWFGISPAITELVCDIICYLLGFKYLGSAFLKHSLIASLSYSFFYSLYEKFPPILPNFENNLFAAAILGAIFVGVGVGLVIRVEAAACGDDALVLVISKIIKLPISMVYLFFDLSILLLSLSYIPFRLIFYSLISVTLSSFIVEKIQNFNLKS